MVKRYQRGNKKQYIKEGHTIQWSSLIYCFLLPLLYLLTIVLYVLLWCTVSYYFFGIFWPLYCMSYNTMVKRYQRGNKKQYIKEGHTIQWSKDTKEVIRNSISKKDIQYNGQKIPKMSFFDVLFLITSLVSFDHCIVCPSLKYCFLLPLWYLLTIVLYVLLWSTVSYYLFCIFWPLYWMSFLQWSKDTKM
jgi:archaellum component FlaF (FlaF/FlaG flagellin family)